MTLARSHTLGLSVAAVLAMSLCTWAEVKTPSIIGDHMVLQTGSEMPIWGTADADEAVAVTLDGPAGKRQGKATADKDGKWMVKLAAIEAAGGPYTLEIKGSNTLTISDVLLGEVWLCGGQSNMEWSLGRSDGGAEAVAAADLRQMRSFKVPHVAIDEPQNDVKAQWVVITPQTAARVSGVGFFFGLRIHQEMQVPVGLVESNWGGTRIEPWIDAEHLLAAGNDQLVQRATDAAAAGRNQTPPPPLEPMEDPGVAKPAWAKPNHNDAAWSKTELPGFFDKPGPDIDGAIWYRRQVTLDESQAGKAMVLKLGTIDDSDITWFNGTEVGRTGKETPDPYLVQREYAVPGELVKAGRNVIAVRVFDWGGAGGFNATGKMALEPKDGAGKSVNLSGPWSVAAEMVAAPDLDARAARDAETPQPQRVPTFLNNGMIAPLQPYAMRGFLWYQGESNGTEPDPYAGYLRTLVKNWRDVFEGPQTQPFYIVQLANWQERTESPGTNNGWAGIREAQRQVSTEPGNGLAVTIDVGDAGDIHPTDKQTVGERLARLALKDVYGKDVVTMGPTPTGATAKDGKVLLRFDHADGLKIKGDDAGLAFEVGDGKRFVWARPTVEGQTVVLSYEGIALPRVVRYAWQINPPAVLWSDELPAGPFTVEVGG